MSRTRKLTGLLAGLLVVGACGKEAVAPAAAAETTTQAARALTSSPAEPRGPIDRILARAAELGLSEEQVARLTAIDGRLEERAAPLRERLRAILGERPERPREMSDAEREAWRAKREEARPVSRELRELSRGAMEEVRGVLTDAQESALRERMERRPDRGPRMRGGPRGGDPLAGLLSRSAELGLSPDQVARLTAIQAGLTERNAPFREQLRAVLGERPERPREMSEAEREAMRAKREQARPIMEQVRENARAALEEARGVLTGEQRAKLREHGERGGRRGSRGRAMRGGERP